MAEPITPRTAREKARRSRMLLFGAFLLVLAASASVTLSVVNIRDQERRMVDSLSRQQEVLARSRMEVVETWLSNLAEQGDRLINADMFRLFASEVNDLGNDLSSLLSPTAGAARRHQAVLSEQLPMMNNLLTEFTAYSDFASGRIVNAHGQTYIATDAAITPLSALQLSYVDSTLNTAKPQFAPLRMGRNGLLLDMFLPIFPPQFEEGHGTPVSVLMLSKQVTGKISEFVATSPLASASMQTRIVQRTAAAEMEEATPWLAEGLRNIALDAPVAGQNIPFAARPAVTGDGLAYSSAIKVPSLDWWIMQETSYAAARTELAMHSQTIITIATLVTLAVALLVGGLWWFLVGVENKREAQEFKALADTINDQKVLLDSINNAITDFIALKDTDGTYRYVNPAFAKAVGRPVEEMLGLDDAAIFGFETARRLKKSDDLVYFAGKPVTIQETIFLQSRKYHVQVSKVPYGDAQISEGIVSVFRDITDAVTAQERSRRVVRQTVDALVATIERADPYLGGHTRMLGALAVELGKNLNMSDAEMDTMQAAANLSQVGKMFVPKEILNKPGPLTEAEKSEMERHVDHAREVLKNIDFDLPVLDTISQMNERLDGSGYPKGLKGDQISPAAKILGLANTFCALLRPRAYRAAKPLETALQIVDDLYGYDPIIVEKLKEVLNSPAGERIVAMAAD